MYIYTETKASVCSLYVAMGIAAEASVTERNDAFETDLSPHTQHIQVDERSNTGTSLKAALRVMLARKPPQKTLKRFIFAPLQVKS